MADLFESILAAFDKCGLWDDGVELIGSWSFLLYQRHCALPPYALKTQDIDFLLPRPYPDRTKVDLGQVLAPLGFKVGFTSKGAVHFVNPDLKIEFLTPERGKGDDMPKLVKPLGIKAVQLRFLDMLFERPLILKEGGITVRVPNPMNFCLHKLIIAQRRLKADKAAKDIEQGVHMLSILEPEDFRAAVRKLPKKWRTLVHKSLQKARVLIPSETATLDKFGFTLQT